MQETIRGLLRLDLMDLLGGLCDVEMSRMGWVTGLAESPNANPVITRII